jgi:hypothetical protein
MDVFYLPTTGIVGSDHTWAMNVFASSLFVWSYAGLGLANYKSNFQGNLPIDIKTR